MGGGGTSSRAARQRRDLLDRSTASAADDVEGDRVAVDEVPAPRGGGQRHCWVELDGVEAMPGVVAAWERTEAGTWQARVAYVMDDETGTVMSSWLPASCLRPYPSAPPSPRAPTD